MDWKIAVTGEDLPPSGQAPAAVRKGWLVVAQELLEETDP